MRTRFRNKREESEAQFKDLGACGNVVPTLPALATASSPPIIKYIYSHIRTHFVQRQTQNSFSRAKKPFDHSLTVILSFVQNCETSE
jgi:hypothetical protein